MTAASATVVASTPFSATPNQELDPSWAGTTPRPGLMPNSRQQAAGTRIEPIPSAPCAIGTIPDATATALPPEEPPGVRSVFQGLRVITPGESVLPQMQSSGTVVIPTTMAPAARSLATTGWSAAHGADDVAADPLRSGSPATAMLSFTATGTPARGSTGRSGRASTAAASASAAAARTTTNARSAESRAAMRSRAPATASVADIEPSRTRAAIVVAVSAPVPTMGRV